MSTKNNDPILDVTGDKKGELLRWVTFKLGNEIYGVNVMQVREVLRYTDIAPVPGAPSYVLGIINLRGNVVTVIDTRSRFGIPPTDVTDNTRIMIIESEKHVIGILVNAAEQLYESGHGEEKLDYVLSQAEEWLKQYHITIDMKKLRALVEAEVLKVNLEKKLVN